MPSNFIGDDDATDGRSEDDFHAHVTKPVGQRTEQRAGQFGPLQQAKFLHVRIAVLARRQQEVSGAYRTALLQNVNSLFHSVQLL